ncbi:uncharacterized protein LOC127277547 [Leptopilina boulardi]|uniref:uncharacterized protein LOC127277547 n=1 Tax=Leptopilina boulardi TaxID=63433 RepID=UPI0021F5E32C|nr:uncharacterized protein LOC127277547 [Leptopilina boulardi]
MKLVLFFCITQFIASNYANDDYINKLLGLDWHSFLMNAIKDLSYFKTVSETVSAISIKQMNPNGGPTYQDVLNENLRDMVKETSDWIENELNQITSDYGNKCKKNCLDILRLRRRIAFTNYTKCLDEKKYGIKLIEDQFDQFYRDNINNIRIELLKAKECQKNETDVCINEAHKKKENYIQCLYISHGFRNCMSTCINQDCFRKFYHNFWMPKIPEFRAHLERECKITMDFKSNLEIYL